MRISPPRRTILDLFRTQVSERPDSIALDDGQNILSYRDLDRLSNRVANHLLSLGIHNEEIVALLIDKSFQFVITSLGVMKAGGTYLPMDPRLPDSRLEFTLSDSGARFLLAWEHFVPRCCRYGSDVIAIDNNLSSFEGCSENDPSVPSDPARRAYVIYTSGSTGKPKGVEIEHHSLSNLISVYHYSFGMTPMDRVTLTANVAFDVSVGDLWPTLAAGATVLIPPKDLFDKLEIPRVIAWVDTQKASIAFMPTAMMPLLMESHWPDSIRLRFMITGGDTLRCRPKPHHRFKVINGYGPTENTVWSTFSVVTPNGTGLPPIGRAIGNVSTYILDRNLDPVHPGDAGELYLGGDQVARGYFNRRELTEEKFFSDPFSQICGARMYHAGDWARLLPDGEIEFLGRRDDQIQIGGIRVELGEIETALLTHPVIAQACCRPLLKDGAVIGTTAHVVIASGTTQVGLDVELKRHLMEIIDPRVIPYRFIVHDAFPITPQGKLDRAALDGMKACEVDEVDEVDEVASIWRTNLPKSAESSKEDLSFFDIGGSSLAAASLLVDVEKVTGKRVPLSVFGFDPTLKGLRRAISQSDNSLTEFITFRDSGERRPIWCMYHLSGDVNAYASLAEIIGSDQPIYGVLSPALQDPTRLPLSIENAAASIVDLIRRKNDGRAPVLLGYSWAGLLAFEVARQWMESEHQQLQVIIIGMDAPMQLLTSRKKLLHFLRWAPYWLPEFKDWFLGWLKNFFGDKGHRFRRLKGIFYRMFTEPMLKELPKLQAWADSGLPREHVLMGFRYRPRLTCPLVIDLIRETHEFIDRGHPMRPYSQSHKFDAGWHQWSGYPPNITWLESNHQDIVLPPTVGKLARMIRTAMDRFYVL